MTGGKGSKTRQSGRADILFRMSPAKKRRIEDAAAEAGMTANGWLDWATDRVLAILDAKAQQQSDAAVIESQQEVKREEIIEVLAAKKRLDLATLPASDRQLLETEADTLLHEAPMSGEPRSRIAQLCQDWLELEDWRVQVLTRDHRLDREMEYPRLFGEMQDEDDYDWDEDDDAA